MLSRNDDSSNPLLEKMINDYQGESSKVEFDKSDSSSESRHHDGVFVAGPPADIGVGKVGVNLLSTTVLGCLATPGELNMEPPTTSESEARCFLIENPTSRMSYQDVKNLEFELGIPDSVRLHAATLFERADWSIKVGLDGKVNSIQGVDDFQRA
ncbi:hypothetical protein Q3G72_026358 [Acer saccharum]|nr:hypothetical protein Q3G72_026358 [Acer saccharum]